jgi:hypothetical protein
VNLNIDSSKVNKVIRSSASFEDLMSAARLSLPPGVPGVAYRGEQGRLLWVRSSHDVRLMFAWYFAQEIAALQIVGVAADALARVGRFALRKEAPYREGMAVFRCECAGPDAVLIFLAVPAALTLDRALAYFGGIFGALASLMFVDDADDIVTIDSPESWEYCLDTARAMAKAGTFSLLLLEVKAA